MPSKRSCKRFPYVITMPILTYNWMSRVVLKNTEYKSWTSLEWFNDAKLLNKINCNTKLLHEIFILDCLSIIILFYYKLSKKQLTVHTQMIGNLQLESKTPICIQLLITCDIQFIGDIGINMISLSIMYFFLLEMNKPQYRRNK